jgi:glycyl-tRNA synthetase
MIPKTGESYIPWVVESSVGLGRCFLAVMSDAYTVESLENGDTRTVLKLSPSLAPVQYAVFPLLKNKPELVEKAREVYAELSQEVCLRVG